MRVGLVLPQFDPRRGGLEQWTWQFTAGLIERGHEVHVVAGRFAEQTLAMPIIVHCLEGTHSPLGFAKAAEAELRSLNLDVIHDMGAGWYCDVFQPHGGSWTAVTQRKLLWWRPWIRPLKRRVDRLLPRHREFRSLLSRQYADNGQILIAVSQAVADDFVRLHDVGPERIRIVYNGVDTDRFSPIHRAQYRPALRRQLGIDNETLLALIVAHNFRLKGLPILLRAMRQLRAESLAVHLVVVGGKRLFPWRRMAKHMGLGTAVTFVGTVDDTAPYYAAADAYVHPTLYDPCSLVLLEAAASGLPLVTTSRFNGFSEMLHDDVEAFLLPDPTDANRLAKSIGDLRDESVRCRMGEAARRKVLEHTFDRNVEDILALYQKVAGSRRRAA